MNNLHRLGGRIHSLDALRAIMMLLGIVLHASETYNIGDSAIWPHDPSTTHVFFNYLSSIIHIFRMPIFFLIAGFFAAMLYYDRGTIPMLKNRVARIILPFIVFLLLLNPIILLATEFTLTTFGTSLPGLSTEVTFLPRVTYHLWFLYYLILITFASFILAGLMKKLPHFSKRITSIFEWLIKRRTIGILILSFCLFIMLVWMWNYWAPTPLTFVPDLKVFVFYLFFYLFGWVLFKSKHLIPNLMNRAWFFVISGFVIYTTKFVFKDYVGDVAYGALNTIVGWFFIFGFMGLFVRYFSAHSPRMRYLSDASYWVYLIHLPLTLFTPGLLVDLPLPAFAKFLIVICVTTVVCFSSYHYLVRNTFIGKFLNGRKYPSRSPEPIQVAES